MFGFLGKAGENAKIQKLGGGGSENRGTLVWGPYNKDPTI